VSRDLKPRPLWALLRLATMSSCNSNGVKEASCTALATATARPAISMSRTSTSDCKLCQRYEDRRSCFQMEEDTREARASAAGGEAMLRRGTLDKGVG